MWWAQTPNDSEEGEHHRPVAEQRLAREHGDDLADDPEDGQDDDIDLGVAEEPEDVLVEDLAAAGGDVEELGPEVA
jgi:hypothetical protein